VAGLAALGVGIAGLVVLAARPESPITPPLVSEPVGWLRAAAEALALDRLSRDGAAGLSAVLLILSTAGFLLVLRSAWRMRLRVSTVIIAAAVLHGVVLLAPLLFSRDVYSYATYGRIVSVHHDNPYVTTPADVPDDPFTPVVSREWIDMPSVYGPAFSLVAAGVTRAVRSPAMVVSAFRVLAAVASLAALMLIVFASRRLAPERSPFAAALFGLNPVVLLHTVGGGHNDALLALCVAGAVALLSLGRPLIATAALALATAFKVSAAVSLIVFLVGVAVSEARLVRALLRHAAVAMTVVLAFAVPFVSRENPTLTVFELASVEGWLAPSRFLRTILQRAGEAAGAPGIGAALGTAVRIAFPLLLLGGLVLIGRNLARSRPGEATIGAATGWATLIALLAAPLLLPWYVTLLLPLAFLLPRAPRAATIALSAVLGLTEVVAEPMRSPPVWEAALLGVHYVASPLALFVLVRLLLDLRTRLATGAPLSDLDPPAGGEQPAGGTDPESEDRRHARRHLEGGDEGARQRERDHSARGREGHA